VSSKAHQNGHRNGASRNGDEPPQPPQNLTAECWLLGALLVNPALFAQADEIEPHYFTLERHRRIFKRMKDLRDRGAGIDYTTVYLEMQEHKEADSDLLTYLVDLPAQVPGGEFDIGFYIRKVRDVAIQRSMFFNAHKLMLQAAHPMDDLKFILSDSQGELARLIEIHQNGSHPVSRLDRLPSVWKSEVQMNFIIEGLLLEGALTMLSGQAGDGKSTFSLALAGAVAQGKPFLGRVVKQRPVLYLDRENPVYVVKDRLLRLRIPEIPALKIWGMWWEGNEPPGPEDPEIIEFARQKPLIVIDSLIAFARCDENSSQEMRRHMELYKKLCYLGASVLFIHHASDKAESLYRGSSDIKAVIDAALHLCRSDGSGSADALGQLELEEFKTRGMIGGKIRMEFRDNGFHTLDAPRHSPREMIKELIRSHPSATTRELITLARPLGIVKASLLESLTSMILKREVSTTVGKHRSVHHYISDQSGAQGKIAPAEGVPA
jgi:archaellum biogenesis ATPase FlaH